MKKILLSAIVATLGITLPTSCIEEVVPQTDYVTEDQTADAPNAFQKFVDGITNRDYPMIMGTTIFLAVLMVTMNLVTDIVYKLVDPRIKLD